MFHFALSELMIQGYAWDAFRAVKYKKGERQLILASAVRKEKAFALFGEGLLIRRMPVLESVSV